MGIAEPACAIEDTSGAYDRISDELVSCGFAENPPVLAEIRLAHLGVKAVFVEGLISKTQSFTLMNCPMIIARAYRGARHGSDVLAQNWLTGSKGLCAILGGKYR